MASRAKRRPTTSGVKTAGNRQRNTATWAASAKREKGRTQGPGEVIHVAICRARPRSVLSFPRLFSRARSLLPRPVPPPPRRSLPPHSFKSFLSTSSSWLPIMKLSALALGLLLSGSLSQAVKISVTQRKQPKSPSHKRSGTASFHRPVLAAAPSSSSDDDGDLDLRYVVHSWHQ